jgi:hypothetical protein
MRRGSTAAFAVLAGAVAFGAVTLFALEGKGIAVLHTRQPGGEEHRTHVWFADSDGALWVEAATASRPFYTDLAADPDVTVEIRGAPPFPHITTLHGRAELVPEPGGHQRIRDLLAHKYGWADAWVALLTDTSASRAVRIVVNDQDPHAGPNAAGD